MVFVLSIVSCAALIVRFSKETDVHGAGVLLPSASSLSSLAASQIQYTIGALIIRVGFGGLLYYHYNKEPPKYYKYLLRPL